VSSEADWDALVTQALLLTAEFAGLKTSHETVWFGCGWRLSEVPLNDRGYEAHGWWWGPGKRLWWCTDGADSVTVRADTIFDAVRQLQEHGMPPKTLGKLNWSALR
jgi:hypothetical protein